MTSRFFFCERSQFFGGNQATFDLTNGTHKIANMMPGLLNWAAVVNFVNDLRQYLVLT